MKRLVEKVKDIVEICPFTHLHDFAADPVLTLAGYHFTDITADLMSKWVDRVARVRTGNGAALALAGFRGVGKSHFISVLGAIVSRPELRSRISDAHVASSAERLSRRHGPVAFVRRGTGTSLLDELKSAVGLILDVNPGTLNDSLYDLLLRASDHAGELPLVVLIDTAFGRDTRVARDDGTLLSEIAEAAKALGIFVGIALDDDISGADGPNASIAGNYNIDYLDQEHLYKIVESHIFSKHSQMLPVLHDIYADYRAALPGFRWSEQRFTSLYPLHPATVEIAPLIRLYIHDFALLGFAAEAGIKILGRPANSLIGLDEVFDSVETKLRLVPDLADAFTAFDRLEREVISKTPVHLRHPAKLILKGLLMLSLNGVGASAPEIAASMMIFGENAADSQSLEIEALLDSCESALPKSVEKIARDGAAPKYSFRLTTKLDFDGILTEALPGISDDVVWNILLSQTAEKYGDFDAANDLGRHPTHCTVEWRGGARRGEVVWNHDFAAEDKRDHQERPDWSVCVEPGNGVEPCRTEASMVWHLAELTADEKDSIRRYHLLHNDADVREQFGDGLSTALHVHSISVEKIWQRVFLEDGLLTCEGLSYRFPDEARSAHSLSQMFTIMLAPVFESQYPAHPEFAEHLGMKQASSLIANFFSGAESNNAEAQTLAELFAYPLGLAAKVGEGYVPVGAESLMENQIVRAVLHGSESESVVPLSEISRRLQAEPIGLTREAQHLILAALVAQRQYEFVTSSGNRINHRSLDLQIIWDDIVGVAKPLNELFAPERLLSWAKLITGNSVLRSLDRSEDRLLIIDSLSGWLTGWKQSRTIDEFDALPDENLNAGIWRTAANLRKSFGAMADTIDLLVKNDVSLDQCLHLIADLFSDSEAEFEKKKTDLRVLRDFTAAVSKRGEIATYLSLCEITDDVDIEQSRLELLDSISSGKFSAIAAGKDQLEAAWINFRDVYTNYYADKHELVMNTGASGEKLREIIRSDEWSTFESLSSIAWLDQRYFAKAKALIREIRQLYCDAKVHETLNAKPFCGCSFSLSETDRLVDLPGQLSFVVKSGLESFNASFIYNTEKLVSSANSDAMGASVKAILSGFAPDGAFPSLASQEIRILKIAADQLSADHTADTIVTDRSADQYSRDFPENMRLWERDVEQVEAFVNTEI
jgi:hypothetical protein